MNYSIYIIRGSFNGLGQNNTNTRTLIFDTSYIKNLHGKINLTLKMNEYIIIKLAAMINVL